MDNDRLLKEAQLIAQKYPFYMVKGQLNHLYGYIYQSEDEQTKYAMDIVYGDSFPDDPPQLSFRQEIPNLPAEIQLNSLNNWTKNSQVVDIVSELAVIVKRAVLGEEDIPQIQEIPQPKLKSNENNSADTAITNNDSMNNSSAEANNKNDEYITPNEEYVTPNEEYLTPDQNWSDPNQPSQYPEWNSEDLNQADNANYITPQNNSNNLESASKNSNSQNQGYAPEEIIETQTDADVTLATETAMIQQEYAMDYIENSLSKVEIYLTITIEQTFIIKIDFSEFPKRPKLELPEGVTKLLGDINNSLEILKNWNENQPNHIVEIIRELEGKLWFLSDLELEAKMISGEYKADMIDGIISNLKVTLYTYGFKEYTLDIDISKYPAQPDIKYSEDLMNLIKNPVDQLTAFKKWKKKESHSVEILREISWLVDKSSRINFELDLLKGGMKDVRFDEKENSIYAKLEGKMKTEGVSFDFQVQLPSDYPMNSPKIQLKSKLEGREDLKKELTSQINTFISGWHQFNYLIDLFNKVSKAIFAVSVVSCVICHKIECPACAKPISAQNPDEQCQVMCPSCERMYHKGCWNQTIASFGKCGFCLRPPPDNMREIP